MRRSSAGNPSTRVRWPLDRLNDERMMQFTGPMHDDSHRSLRESDKISWKDRDASCDDKTARRHLYQALESHKFDLEITRSVASGLDLKTLDRRMEAVRMLLKWLSQALELEHPASPAVQKPPP
jgi:hypothetical protein